jgi:hypothetical protein
MAAAKKSNGIPGVPIDADGNSAGDPTKNVRDLVEAAITRFDDLLEQFIRRQDDLREQLDRRFSDAGTIRTDYDTRIEKLKTNHQNQLESIKADFNKQIAAILAQQTEKSATLLSAQVAATTERLAVVEKNQYVGSGQTAVRDPSIDIRLTQMGDAIALLSKSKDSGEGSRAGQAQAGQIMQYVIMGLIAVSAIVIPLLIHKP